MPWNTGLGAVCDQKMNAGFGGLLIGQIGSRGIIYENFRLGQKFMVVYKTTTRVRIEVAEEKYCCDFAVEFSTTKQNMIVEQNYFQEAQNYTSLFVLEKKEERRKSFRLAFNQDCTA